MKLRTYVAVFILSGLVTLWGCSQTEKKAEQTEDISKPTGSEAKQAAQEEAEQPGGETTQPSTELKESKKLDEAPKAAENLLFSPHAPEMNQKAPESFKARFETSKGTFVVQVTRSWSPNGADRFYNLVKAGFYNDCRFFRVIPGFMGQFGINGDPQVSQFWRQAPIDDDPVKSSNTRGRITYAMAGPNTRTTQLFINFGNNARLDSQGFSPFGEVAEGMDVVDAINGEYGEGAPRGRGPDQSRIQMEGNRYLHASFSGLDYIKKASIIGKN